uniref:Uncharacterized protein n=1 Tax=Polysiphonia urceolata TaxID=173545 RepID=A0A1Z1MC01_POLUR|nr:hypothetical protein [Polysiphonia stricta]ARW63506.1 hypothetical protein [Polysiphonia stricta]
MNIKLYSLLEYIEGNWFLQENYYLLNKKIHQNTKTTLNFSLKLSNLNNRSKYDNMNVHDYNFYNDYQYSIVINKSLIKIFNLYENSKSYLLLQEGRINQFKVQKILKQKRIHIEEYLYLNSNNIIISIMLLKSLTNNRYLGIKVSSYIRSLKN